MSRISFRKLVILAMAICLIAIVSPCTAAQESGRNFTQVDKTAVILSGEPLFVIQARVGSFSPEERTQAVTKRITTLAEDVSISVDALRIEEQPDATSIVVEDRVILTLIDADARAADTTRQKLGVVYLDKIKDAVQRYRDSRSLKSILLGVLYSFAATILFIILFKVLKQLSSRIYSKLDSWRGTRIPALRIQGLELLPATQITDILIRCVKFLGFVLNLGLLYGYITLVLSLFPWTKPIAASLSRYLLAVLDAGWQAFNSYVPNLFVIALVIIVTYYVLQFVKFIFVQLGRTRDIPWFYPEWAEPTYKLATVLVIAFAAIVVFPYLPGSQSPAFQGVSLFLGLLLSLGSSSAVANIVAGVILIYTRAFHIGDRVKVGEAIGDIVEKTLLVTRIRTIKNVVITIPNATVLNSQIVNYSALAQDPGNHLILHTTITLGYDLPWRKVHAALIEAACATAHILTEPAPFVLQTSLDDFYVSYELNAYTDQPTIMAKIYSELHQNIQDKCNEAGIEILSPHYRAVRDGNQNTIPADYLPKDYQAPGFRLFPLDPQLKSANGRDTSEFDAS